MWLLKEKNTNLYVRERGNGFVLVLKGRATRFNDRDKRIVNWFKVGRLFWDYKWEREV